MLPAEASFEIEMMPFFEDTITEKSERRAQVTGLLTRKNIVRFPRTGRGRDRAAEKDHEYFCLGELRKIEAEMFDVVFQPYTK